MVWYQILFLLGFMVAVLLLAVASLQVAELDKKVERFSKDLLERYTKPLSSLDEEAAGKPSSKQPS